MLTALETRNFALLANARIDFPAHGFCALTGETGAGKSMLVGALALVLGGRLGDTLIKPGSNRAEITACFTPSAAALSWLQDAGMNEPDDLLVVRRVIDADRRSRAFVNGRPTALVQLAELVGGMVSICGQHEHLQLRHAGRRRSLLEAYAGAQEQAAAVAATYQAWQQAQRKLAAAEQGASDHQARRQRLTALLSEADMIGLSAQTWAEHNSILGIHGSAAEVAGLLQDSSTCLAASLAQLAEARQATERIAVIDPAAANLAAMLGEVEDIAAEALREISRRGEHANQIDVDALTRAEEFMSQVHTMMRLHNKASAQDLLTSLADARQELAELSNDGVDQARELVRLALASWLAAARDLAAKRRQAGPKLATKVCASLRYLGMREAVFKIELPASNGEPSPHGSEDVVFTFGPRASLPAGSLSTIASGGELSRVALALLAEADRDIGTLVFDEIDAGVGGKVAAQIGTRLAALGRKRLVLCVTHLPQVAAAAAHHWQIAVNHNDQAEVTSLGEAQRIEEIARMLTGHKITEASRRNARELLANRHPT